MGVIAQKAVAYAVTKLGYPYSQQKRMQSGYFDCSSLVDRAFADAGYTFQTENNTSCYLVYDKGLDLIYPASTGVLGKQLTSIATLVKQGYTPMPGDIVFIRTSDSRDGWNKITHVALVESPETMIHARGTKYGVVRTSIDLYGAAIVAVARLREETAKAVITEQLGECIGDEVKIRQKPNGTILGSVDKGQPLVIGERSGGWSRVVTLIGDAPVSGYMFDQFIKIKK